MTDGKLSDIVNPLSNIVGYENYADAKKAYNALMGGIYSKLLMLGAVDNNMPDVYQRVNLNTVKETGLDLPEVWAMANIKGFNFDTDDEKFTFNGFGAQIGDDIFNNGEHFVGGIFAGFSANNFKQDSESGNMTDISLGIYGGHFYNSIRLGWAFSLGMQNFSTQRDLSFANLKTESDFNTYSARFAGEIKYIANFYNDINLTPFISAQGGYVMSGDIEEKSGAAADLNIEASNYLRFYPTLGVGLENKEGLFQWFIQGYIGYLIAGNKTPDYSLTFAQAKDLGTIDIQGQELNSVIFGGGLGCEFVFSEYISIFINSNLETTGIVTGYRAGAGVNIKI
jgi:hypothetical protein